MEKRSTRCSKETSQLALPHSTSYKVFHLPNETKIQKKSQQGTLFWRRWTCWQQTCSAGVDHSWRRMPDDATKQTSFTPLFVCFFLTNRQNSSSVYLQFFEGQKRRQERVISPCSVGVTERTSSFRVLGKVDFDVLVRRWSFFQDARQACEFSKNFPFPWTLLDVDVTGPTVQSRCGVLENTNDRSRERETRIALVSHDVFHVLDSHLRSTHGRKKTPTKWRHRRRSGAFEGVAVQGRRLSRRSGPLRLEIAG